MYTDFKTRELQPFSECPIWARLEFTKMIPETYFWDYWNDEPVNPRKISEVTVQGFERDGEGLVYVDYTMDWIDDGQIVTNNYFAPVFKPGM